MQLIPREMLAAEVQWAIPELGFDRLPGHRDGYRQKDGETEG